MRKKRTYIILIILLLAFALFMFVMFGRDYVKKGKYSTVLIIGNNTVFTYDNKMWKRITNVNSLNDLSWKKYSVFVDKENIGNYYLSRDDRWYAFDDEKNAIDIDGDLLGISSNHDITVLKVDEILVDNSDTIVQEVLLDNNLSISSEFTSAYKVVFDFDNDGSDEEFYILSNAFPTTFTPTDYFSIAFMVKDNKIYYIYNDFRTNDLFNGCKPYFNTFLDIDNDNKYEFIFSCSAFSENGRADMLYKFSQNNFKIIISNQ